MCHLRVNNEISLETVAIADNHFDSADYWAPNFWYP